MSFVYGRWAQVTPNAPKQAKRCFGAFGFFSMPQDERVEQMLRGPWYCAPMPVRAVVLRWLKAWRRCRRPPERGADAGDASASPAAVQPG